MRPVLQALALAQLLAGPALAWEFTATPVCTVTHETASAALRLTHDPAQPQPYTIAITAPGAWPDSGIFGIRFEGARPLTITTDRQRLSTDGRRLSVSDTGFGNVLNGLEFNALAIAFLGETAVPFPLDGAAPAIAAFRACIDAPTA